MGRLLLVIVGLLYTTTLLAQRGSIVGELVDESTKVGIAGAVIELSPEKNVEDKRYFASGYNGAIDIEAIAYGSYNVTISFIGYDSISKSIKLNASTANLGTIALKESSVNITAVVKEVQALRASQKGDTISYNAGAFKVTDNADVEGLLKKMPGISISNGTIEAQGETVEKIYVDGKEFFGSDVTTAIKSLPADAVDKIEVYNKLSDAAEFSGVDDGEGHKALNIVTKKDMRKGLFGKLTAGYGYDPQGGIDEPHKYIAGGTVNLFDNDRRISILTLFNNVNEHNFSFEDVIGSEASSTSKGHSGGYMMPTQKGIASVNAIGVNYSDVWGEEDKIKVQASYFFNNTETENTSVTEKWFEDPSPADTLISTTHSLTPNYNHRFDGRFDWKISDNHSLMIRPGFSYQSNDPESITNGYRFGESGYNLIDNSSEKIGAGYSAKLFGVYRMRLGENGRNISIDGGGRYSSNDSDKYSWSNQSSPNPALPEIDGSYDDYPYSPIERLYQYQYAPTLSSYLSGRVTYTEPISERSHLTVQYRISNEYQELDKITYTSLDGFDNILGGDVNERLSNSYQSRYLTQRIGPGYRYNKDKSYFVASAYFEHSQLEGNVVKTDADQISKSYDNITYFMMGNLQLNKENMLKLFVYSRTSSPSITLLQDVYDLSNLQNISKGNPNLDAPYSNTVRFHYVNSNIEKARTFMWMFSLVNTSNYIATSTEYNKEISLPSDDGTNVTYRPFQYRESVNLDGHWNMKTRLNYGLPFNFIKSNVNLIAGVNYNITPSMVDKKVNEASTIGYTGGAVLGSNISENVDFTFEWMGTYNQTSNSLATSEMKNRYFNHTAKGFIRLIFPLDFTLTTSGSYTQYIGFTNDYDDSYILCSAWLGKRMFKNKRGEISVGVNDLFNQNLGFVRSTGSGWSQNVSNSVMGRYYMAKFTYTIKSFSKSGDDHRGPGRSKGHYGGMF